MELFMIKTGFYGIVTRKEAERRLERYKQEEDRNARLKYMKSGLKGASTSIGE
jgi:hypothetical protein